MRLLFTLLVSFLLIDAGFSQSLTGATPLYPPDGDTIRNRSSLAFTWAGAPGGVSYSFKLFQVLGNQSPIFATQANPAFFTESVSGNAMIYPAYARDLTPGRYAWQIVNNSTLVQGDNQMPLAVGSEVHSFYYAAQTSGCVLDFSKDSNSFYMVDLSQSLRVSSQQLTGYSPATKAKCRLARMDGTTLSSFWLDLRTPEPVIDLATLLSNNDIREAGGQVRLIVTIGNVSKCLLLVFNG